MKHKKEITKILNDMSRELAGLANGGVVGIKNCTHITLLSANISLIREYLEQEKEAPAEKEEAVKEAGDDNEHSDDLCEPE